MKSSRYLNVILTVNAALLSAIAWTHITGSAGLAPAAHAAPVAPVAPQNPPAGGGGAGGIPNAGGQRERMIDELVAIRASIDGLKKTVEGGKLKITVANIDELKAATKPADADKGK